MRAISLFLLLALAGQAMAEAPKYVFFFVVGGMGPEQVKAASMYLGGAEGFLNFEKFPYKEIVPVKCADSGPADEAAAATGLATGVEVHRGVISMKIPGQVTEKDPESVLEYSQDRLTKSTGIVTDSFLTDVVPAAFASHEPNFHNYERIAEDYLKQTRPNVMLGGGGFGMDANSVREAGYATVTNKDALEKVDYAQTEELCGIFGEGPLGPAEGRSAEVPSLAQMTSVAIKTMEGDSDGFFLMVNASNVARADSRNDISAAVAEMLELQKAVQVAINWAAKDPNETLILVAGDIEIGGLKVVTNNGAGKLPGVTWVGSEPTESPVAVFAWGRNSQMVQRAPSNLVMCVVATYDPNLPPPASRWKSVVIVGLLALMVIMMILARGGNKAKDW